MPSLLCTEASLRSESFLGWADRLRPVWDYDKTGIPVLTHRKLWEWLFIVQALHERGKLGPGRRGLGFGVGQDPLASIFASLGCEIVATDLDPETAASAGWDDGLQYSTDPLQLNQHRFCDPDVFARLVSSRAVDMRRIPQDLREFDFSWSACAFEHLGSIDAGRRFVVDQMRCLKRGGVGVHTTEYNVSSNLDTIEKGPTVVFRKRDVEELVSELRALGHKVVLDLDTGSSEADRHVDTYPYSDTHLKTLIGDHVVTSLGFIVKRSSRPVAALRRRASKHT
jgi:Methyltransferase domain